MTNRLRKIAERLKECFHITKEKAQRSGKPLVVMAPCPAVMAPCPGVVNDGLFGHAMRDFCVSCTPFWEQYPTCPVHRTKLSRALYCHECGKFYARPVELDLRLTEQEFRAKRRAKKNAGNFEAERSGGRR